MPYSYVVVPAERRLDITFRGDVTMQDIFALRGELLEDALFDPSYDQLLDASSVASMVDIGPEQLRQLAGNRSGVHVDGARRVFVVSSDLQYGFARMFQMLTNSDEDMHVFREVGAALEWLGSA